MLAAIAFIAVGCTKDPVEPEAPNQDGTEQTPGTGDNGDGSGDEPGGEDPGENPGGEDPGENPGENPEDPALPGTEISLFDFAQLPNTDETLYRVSGVVWTVDVEDNETMVILGTRLYDEDDFDPTKDAVAGIMNPTWLKDLNPALRPGHVLTVVGNKGAFGDDPDGDAMILNSQYVSHVDYSEPYLVFDMYVKPYLYSESGAYTFNVYSNTDWTVTAPEGTGVSPASGNGCAELIFKYPANASFQDVFYPLVFSYSGKTAELKFQQEALRYSLEISQQNVEVAADATTASVDVVSNGSWTVTTPEGVTATPASGNGNATVTFTFPANTTQEPVQYVAQIAGNGNSEERFVYEFIIDQAAAEVVVPSGIASIKALASDAGTAFNVVLTDAIVTCVSGSNAYVQDENDGILIYASGHGLAVGDKLNGEVSGTVKFYNNLREITAIDLSKAEKSASTYIPVTELTIAELNAEGAYDKYENMRILIKDAEMTAEKEMTQNGQKYALYFKKTPLTGYDMYNRVNVIGYPGKFYENVQFNVFENAEVLGATKTVFTGFSNIEVTVGESKANVATPSSGATVTYESLNTAVATVDQAGMVTGVSEGEATITAKVGAHNGYPAAEVTCVVTVLPAGTVVEKAWTLVTSASSLEVGDKIIIVAKASNYAMSTTQNTNNRAQVAVTKSGNTVTFTTAVQEITLEAGTKSGTFAFNVGASKYLYAASSSKNYLKTGSKDDNASWKIEIASSGVATIKAQGTYSRNWLRYNSSNNPPLFSCYGSGQADVAIYKYQ